MEDERDLSDFDKNVMDLFELCKDILKVHESRNIIKKRNPIESRLTKYIKTYNKTDPEEHVIYFENLLKSNRRFIMLGSQRDAWLKDGGVIITYGEDCGIKTDAKLHLSGIYITACKIKDEIEEELEGLPNADKSEMGFPKMYLLLLYRIFHSITESDNDKEKLSKHISGLESDVGLRRKGPSGNNSDPLSGLFDMASSMAEQMTGKKIPKDKMPGKNDFSKMIGDVINNPQTKSMLGNMMQEMQNTESIGDMVGKLVGGLGGIAGQTASEQTENDNNESTVVGEAETSDITADPAVSTADVNDEFEDF